jgi:hypothetical protein
VKKFIHGKNANQIPPQTQRSTLKSRGIRKPIFKGHGHRHDERDRYDLNFISDNEFSKWDESKWDGYASDRIDQICPVQLA